MKALELEPDGDVTSIEVDLRLSTLKPRHAKVMIELYDYLKTEDGRKIIESRLTFILQIYSHNKW